MGGGQAAPQERNPTSAPASAAPVSISVPPNLDNKRGWQNNETGRAYTMAPQAGYFVDVYAGSDDFSGESVDPVASGGPTPTATSSETAKSTKGAQAEGTVVIARNADKGAVVWSSTPLKKLSILRSPILRVVNTHDGEFVVLVRFGVVPGTGLVRARRLTVVDTFSIASTGGAVAPTRHLERETPGPFSAVGVSIGDGGVLFLGDRVEDASNDVIEAGPATLWDPTTGASSTVQAGDKRRSDVCGPDEMNGCTVRDVPVSTIPAGVLTAEIPARPNARFGLAGGWNSTRIGPAGRTNGTLLGTLPGALLAAWPANDKHTIYAVHDPASGAVLVSGECPNADGGDADPEALRRSFAASPNGRYIVAGSLAIDLSARTLGCLAGDADRRGAALTIVGDNGLAYGSLLADRPPPPENDETPGEVVPVQEPAMVTVATRKIDLLRAGTRIPERLTASGAGLFTLSVQTEEENSSAVIAMCPAAQPPP